MSFASDQLPNVWWTAFYLVKTDAGARTHVAVWWVPHSRWEVACGLSPDRFRIVDEPRLPLCRRCERSSRTTTKREREATW